MSKVRFCSLLLTLLILTVPLTFQAQSEDVDFTEQGAYGAGEVKLMMVDSARPDRAEFEVRVWYPTDPPSRRRSFVSVSSNADLFAADAPYPLIVYSSGSCMGSNETAQVGPYLATHGFVVMSAQHPASTWSEGCTSEDRMNFVNRPLDISLMIDTIGAGEIEGLEAAADLENIGVIGYSLGGYTAMVMGGAQVNDDALRSTFPDGDAVAEYYQTLGAIDDNGYWTDLVDERVDVVAAIAPCGVPLMGADGITSLVLPFALFTSPADEMCPSNVHASAFFGDNSAPEAFWLDWDGADDEIDHLAFMGGTPIADAVLAPQTAFFSAYLKGDGDFATYIADNAGDWDVSAKP